MRGIIRQKGRVDPITERQDVHTAKMMVSSVFCSEGGSILGIMEILQGLERLTILVFLERRGRESQYWRK